MKITTYKKLLMLLQDGEFHSGETLANQLQITRAGVWKTIQQLDELNLSVQSITGKGYRLVGGIELLAKDKISHHLSYDNRAQLKQLTLVDSISSTNDYLLEQFKLKTAMPIACLAEHQIQGRGRRGRSWASPYGNNIYLSLGWHFDKDAAELMGLSLIAGLAIIRALKRYGLADTIHLKWPNDVIWQQRKLAGVLIEVMAQANTSCETIIGIGINTALSQDSSQLIDQPWVDLKTITNESVLRNDLAGILLDELITIIKEFENNGLQLLINEWVQYDYYYHQPVCIHTPQGSTTGIAQGIGEMGELLLLTENNELKRYFSGEISLRANGVKPGSEEGQARV
jgi:BirA family transcriptional regulator, biotin operon repressor / biotin---[acetyl-CoA-carboxylase] ligase